MEQFWSHVEIFGPNDCWPWKRSLSSTGYGQLWINGVLRSAHVWAFEFANHVFLPEGVLVQHSCDFKPCCNPQHLSAGNDKTNAEDKRSKGRAAKKLSLAARQEILLLKFLFSQRTLAKKFGVTQGAIWHVLNNGQ